VADPSLSKRLTWQHQPLLSLATSHPDSGVRLLAVQVLAVQMGWSESYRMERERECVGDVGSVDGPVMFGEELVLENGQAATRQVEVDGWLLPMHEARRAEQREYLPHPS
jgi:midasin